MKKIKLYHGSNKPIRKFNKKYSAQGVFWFSEDKDKILQGRSGASKVDYLIEVEVSVNKTAGWPEYNKFSLGEIENMKYDSIKLDDDWIIFDSNNIKVIKAYNVKKLKEKTYYTNLSTYEVNERPDNLLRVNTIFKNNFAYPIQVDDYINQLFDKVNYNPDLYKTCFQSLPDTMVDVSLIIPTQLYLLKSKMRKYKDKPVNNNSGERPEGIWFDGLFYLLDGHHRVAKMISKGYNYIACKGLNISIPKISENASRKFIDSVYFFLNEYSYPKTVMKLISTLTKGKTSKGLKYVEVLRNKGLESIPTNRIIPTYENLLSSIMKDILSYKSDKVSEFVKYGENYYLINDHYKVAKEIFEGNKFIKGKVVDMNTRLNNKSIYSPEIYRPVFEENRQVIKEKAKTVDEAAKEGLCLSIIKEGQAIGFCLYNSNIIQKLYKNNDSLLQSVVSACTILYNIEDIPKNTYMMKYMKSQKQGKGYGVLLYDIVLSYIGKKGICPDRVEVSSEAKKVWEYYFTNRSDIKTIPIDNIEDPKTKPKTDDGVVHYSLNKDFSIEQTSYLDRIYYITKPLNYKKLIQNHKTFLSTLDEEIKNQLIEDVLQDEWIGQTIFD